jgi:hypothetical protein
MGSILKRALALFLIFSTEALGAYSPYTELQVSGSPIDPRQIRALTTADVISAAQSGGWSTGRTWTLGSGSDSVTALQGGAPWSVLGRPSDGTNSLSKLFDGDSGAGTEWNLGVILRQSASGGSIEVGTSTNPLQIGFASTPTVNLGTLNGAATATNQTSELTKLDTLDTDLKRDRMALGPRTRVADILTSDAEVIRHRLGFELRRRAQSVSVSNFPSNRERRTLDHGRRRLALRHDRLGGEWETRRAGSRPSLTISRTRWRSSIAGTPISHASSEGGTFGPCSPGTRQHRDRLAHDDIGQFGGTNVVTGTGMPAVRASGLAG